MACGNVWPRAVIRCTSFVYKDGWLVGSSTALRAGSLEGNIPDLHDQLSASFIALGCKLSRTNF